MIYATIMVLVILISIIILYPLISVIDDKEKNTGGQSFQADIICNILGYRQRMKDINNDLKEELIDTETKRKLDNIESHRLVENYESLTMQKPELSAKAVIMMIFMSILVLILAVPTYSILGEPDYRPHHAGQHGAEMSDMSNMGGGSNMGNAANASEGSKKTMNQVFGQVGKLKKDLEEKGAAAPAKDWLTLASFYVRVGKMQKAYDILVKGYNFKPKSLEIIDLLAYTASQAFGHNDGYKKSIDLLTSHKLPKELHLLHKGDIEAVFGNYPQALKDWAKLQSILKPTDDLYKQVGQYIMALTEMIKKQSQAMEINK